MSDMGQYTQNPLPSLSNLDQSASFSSLPPMDNYRRMQLPSPPRHSSPPRARSPPRGHSPPRARSPQRSYRQDDSFSRSRDRSRSPPPRYEYNFISAVATVYRCYRVDGFWIRFFADFLHFIEFHYSLNWLHQQLLLSLNVLYLCTEKND